MGIHYDYKSKRGERAMLKEAKRKERLALKRAKRASTSDQEEIQCDTPSVEASCNDKASPKKRNFTVGSNTISCNSQ